MSTKRQLKRELREVVGALIDREIDLGTYAIVTTSEKDLPRAEAALREIADEVRCLYRQKR